jgi:hypothetical protein
MAVLAPKGPSGEVEKPKFSQYIIPIVSRVVLCLS